MTKRFQFSFFFFGFKHNSHRVLAVCMYVCASTVECGSGEMKESKEKKNEMEKLVNLFVSLWIEEMVVVVAATEGSVMHD